MATRIYQGKIVRAQFEDPDEGGTKEVLMALKEMHELFQDAVNYYIVALAGMASDDCKEGSSLGSDFKERVQAIWGSAPKGKEGACTLKESICRTLCLNDATFQEAVDKIFAGCERKDILPYALQFIIDKTAAGAGAIQKQGRELLPKICDPEFSGNYDFSKEGRSAAEGNKKLREFLNSGNLDKDAIVATAMEMNLSWAGIKIQGEKTHEDDSIHEVKESMEGLLSVLKDHSNPAWAKLEIEQGRDFYSEVKEILKEEPLTRAPLMRNNKARLELRYATIFFMYYPCALSADLLKAQIKGVVGSKSQGSSLPYDYTDLEDDPLILTRGKRGCIFRGFSALPSWASSGENIMYNKEWDIAAFKEALKALHGFALKMDERRKRREELQDLINYMKSGQEGCKKGNPEDEQLVVFKGDIRYDLLLSVEQELSEDLQEGEFRLSQRSINGFDRVKEEWMRLIREGSGTEENMKKAVGEVQSQGGKFGSQLFFALLCKEKYHPIWRNDPPTDKFPRSKSILKDFVYLNELIEEEERLQEPVRLTAAEPQVSPRLIILSDMKKATEFIDGEKGGLKLRVIRRNERGLWQRTTAKVYYSAPRLERDHLGTDSDKWKSSTTYSEGIDWLQPMLKALELSDVVHLKQEENKSTKKSIKKPAVSLFVKTSPKDDAYSQSSDVVCLLNFPVSLDFKPLHHAIGKAEIWDKQFLGRDEKLHLHWPATYKGSNPAWWKNEEVKEKGFEILSIDLGVRYAAAWSIAHIHSDDSAPSFDAERLIGVADDVSWYGRSIRQGLIRLDGEFPATANEDKNTGTIRRANPDEQIRIRELFRICGLDIVDYESLEPDTIQIDLKTRNILSLNNSVLYIFRRILSRYRFLLNIHGYLADPLVEQEKQGKALSELKEWIRFVGPTNNENITSISLALKNDNRDLVRSSLGLEVSRLRKLLPEVAEKATNLILPRHRGRWMWCETLRGDKAVSSGVMRIVSFGLPNGSKKYIRRMGGLSVDRLTQIEGLRQRLQSMNRLLWQEIGKDPRKGRVSRDFPVIDPCPEIRIKIENIRETRVNKIAHEIVALALGVRLITPSRQNKNPKGKDIVHGEYERIPGRKPVSMVVLENLSTYRTSIDKDKRENSTLMRWAHRQITAKVVQLLGEVFGIPVIFTHASYTSKFDSVSSAPGFRADAMTEKRIRQELERIERRLKSRSTSEDEVLKRRLGQYLERLATIGNHGEQVSLYMPSPSNSGEFFISRDPQGRVVVRNADINAAVNIGWRALAAPQSLHLLHKIRMNKTAKDIQVVRANEREKGAFKKDGLQLSGLRIEDIEGSGPFNAFYDATAEWKKGKRGVSGGQESVSICYSKILWKEVKDNRWELCDELNSRILSKIGLNGK